MCVCFFCFTVSWCFLLHLPPTPLALGSHTHHKIGKPFRRSACTEIWRSRATPLSQLLHRGISCPTRCMFVLQIVPTWYYTIMRPRMTCLNSNSLCSKMILLPTTMENKHWFSKPLWWRTLKRVGSCLVRRWPLQDHQRWHPVIVWAQHVFAFGSCTAHCELADSRIQSP